MKINVLESRIYNRIAAGEIVERPSSIVKELFENSIDAGASVVTIEVENYGIKKIKITDNGCGINADDVEKAFLPHATSKISGLDDLDKISTMGFRGEALPSIAAVSMVEMQTRTEKDDLGTKIILRGGLTEEVKPCSCAVGTVITVENLFFNTPARLKFLRQKRTEENDIYFTILKLSTANPYISVKYILDGKVMLSTDGIDMQDLINKNYPLDIANNLLPVEKISEYYEVVGFVGKRGFSKPNKNYQTIIINGRVVTNSTISQAVSAAFGDGLTKGGYPIFILDIVMPFEDVDVNVHPNKKDVRFRDNNKIYSLIYKAITECFNKFSNDSVIEYSDYGTSMTNKGISNIKIDNSYSDNKTEHENKSYDLPKNVIDNKYDNKNYQELLNTDIDQLSKYRSFDDKNDPFKMFLKRKSSNVGFADIDGSSLSELLNKEIEIKKQIAQKNIMQQRSMEFLLKPKVVGQIFGTYLIVEKEDFIYVFDQHACHEKLIYDRLLDEYRNQSIIQQELLVPYILNLNYYDNMAFSEFKKYMEDIGFGIEDCGDFKYKITRIPLALIDINLQNFINELSKNGMRLAEISITETLKEQIALIACKTAVKGNTSLSDEQIDTLFSSFVNDDKFPLYCPHGRPAVIKINKNYIDKIFRRDY